VFIQAGLSPGVTLRNLDALCVHEAEQVNSSFTLSAAGPLSVLSCTVYVVIPLNAPDYSKYTCDHNNAALCGSQRSFYVCMRAIFCFYNALQPAMIL